MLKIIQHFLFNIYHMKYLKTFEYWKDMPKGPYYLFEDDYLKIQGIKNNENKGTIVFRFKKNKYVSKYSILFGCVKLLDTKYEGYKIIRDIKYDSILYSPIHHSTVIAILNKFIADKGYKNKGYKNNKKNYKFIDMNIFKDKFQNKIILLPLECQTLGEILDGLREIRSEFFDYFEQLEAEYTANLYNM